MPRPVAALPMYDWPECRAETDAVWSGIRDRLISAGLDAPDRLVRRNGDLPSAPGGIVDAAGRVIAPDPGTLAPDELDLPTLWRHPDLLLAQTCWGPMELGLADLVQVVGQPDYSMFEGGEGPLYSSAILMRWNGFDGVRPKGRAARLPLDRLRGARLAFNAADSMSGYLALSRDLEAAGEGLAVFADRIETGAHRASIRAVAEGRADVCAVDCRSWALAKRFEPAADKVAAVGWTAKRPGLPFITSRRTPAETVAALLEALRAIGMIAGG